MGETLVNVGVSASEITNILIDHAFKRDTVDKAFTTSSGSNTGYRIEKGNVEDITMNLSLEYGGETEMETGDTEFVSLVETSNSCDNLSHDGCTRRVYSRTQLEALRSVCVKEQKEKWRQIYNGLGPDLSSEYDSLAHSVNKKHVPTNSRSQRQPSGGKERTNTAKSKHLIEVTDTCDPSHSQYLIEDSPTGLDEECSHDSDSDDQYDGILKPAFHVDGEPDFDSGPPEDGMEYLRRVRWEASQIPKVKVAKLDRSKINQSQSDYMPKIPDIAKCPNHLLPSIEWEEIFLAQFKKLRLAISSSQLSSFSCSDASSGDPTLSVILGMEPVTRVSMLRRRISLLTSSNTLSQYDCVWLFALCAAVDTPLDADTCASLRCLLRKCASLLAEKVEIDEEVPMLNILATVSGKYFKQLDS